MFLQDWTYIMNLRSRRATHIMLNFGTECRMIQRSRLFPQSKRDFNTCGKIATSFTQWPPSSRASSKATPSQTRKSRSSTKTGPLSALCWQQRTALWCPHCAGEWIGCHNWGCYRSWQTSGRENCNPTTDRVRKRKCWAWGIWCPHFLWWVLWYSYAL